MYTLSSNLVLLSYSENNKRSKYIILIYLIIFKTLNQITLILEIKMLEFKTPSPLHMFVIQFYDNLIKGHLKQKFHLKLFWLELRYRSAKY